ncbi:hypothetical protein V492_06225 [Pseudogymnoascus sp. VKM F-4246]|nr:hypothetical protein V492_06225 [Pseudogymnoascus sp. VKM F-4246]
MAPPPRSALDADELLLNGFFRTSRSRQTAPSPPPVSGSLPVNPKAPATYDTRQPSRSRSAQPPRRGWPPKPHVEDEKDSLLREHGEAYATALYDPPSKGVIDQLPILYDSELSASDSMKQDPTVPEPPCHKEDNAERRFVLVPNSDTHSSAEDDTRRKPKNIPVIPVIPVVPDKVRHQKDGRDSPPEPAKPRHQKESRDAPPEQTKPRHRKETRDSPPPITRRRSRQDLPALTTDNLAPQPPPFRRSTSAYSYNSRHDEPGRTLRSPSASTFLSPDSTVGNGGHFDMAAHSLPRKYGGSSPKPSSPMTERKPTLGGSLQPPTPSHDKRGGSVDSRARSRGDPAERPPRPQTLGDDSSSRRPERPSSRINRHDSYERHHSRQSSTQSTRKGYDSSDLDDSDSSNSDRRRRRHRRHPSRHGDSLYPEVEPPRHRRTGSNQSNVEFGTPKKTFSMPLPSPRAGAAGPLAAAGLAAGLLNNQRKDTYPVFEEATESQPASPFSPYDANAQIPYSAPVRQRDPSPVDIDPLCKEPSASVPMPIPMNGRGRGDPYGQGSYSSGTSPTKKDYWQPPPFQPPAAPPHLEVPSRGYVRRFSEDIGDGTIAPLLPCPRTSPVRGKVDWLTLPKCRGFNICPSCYQSAIEQTSFQAFFVPAPFRSLDDEVSCDFGTQPWYRIAWLLLKKNRASDLALLHQIAHISATTSPCLGGHEATRKWHSVRDPDSGRLVNNFNVCHACTQVVEALLPATRGLFVPTHPDGAPAPKRTCDLRFDSPRFLHYFDALELISDKASASGRAMDPRPFAALAKRYVATPTCRGDKEVFDSRWYSIAQLPELSVCTACFEEVVRPEAERRRAIAAMFALGREVPVGSCGMHSRRMREVFKEAVRKDDYVLLARAARERREREVNRLRRE